MNVADQAINPDATQREPSVRIPPSGITTSTTTSTTHIHQHGNIESEEPAKDDWDTFKKRPITHEQGLQKLIVWGLGAALAASLFAVTLIALVRPELVDFLTSLSQLLLGGLIGVGGSIVGYLFAERKSS